MSAIPSEPITLDLNACLCRDRHFLRRELDALRRSGDRDPVARKRLHDRYERSRETVAQRLRDKPPCRYPAELPVVARRNEIASAVSAHQVIVLCGETGSGKTTQLPKICLDIGRGVSGMIGHTQPRRIAARSVATRIAQELNVQLGHEVGYKIRFGDHVSPRTFIKLMTDGILLNETQSDRYLSGYDTIIIDEAHERSLNIDFLLGYLHQLLPKRPDLKLIITSATIDPQRFSRHFGNAPIIEVSGRTYPVETRYRPLVSDDPDEDDLHQIDGILHAVDELCREGRGDVLVFLPGEREIRDSAEALRKHHPPETEILPLYSRLSADEQMRIFQPHQRRRIVLATNVAETSLTVPGIKYIVDPGTARISRYSPRSKVQRLPIEPVSQASANQRKGRCGRVEAGVCIRLFSEEDFASRAEFTEPEILRTNLASVILQMRALHLGEPEKFPFLEPPDSRAIRDGYITLHEIGAVDERNELTRVGHTLAKLPVDPRIGRMILAGIEEEVAAPVLIIAAALSTQDPRERPVEKQDAADTAHSAFKDEQSDFLSYLKLWDTFHSQQKHLSGSKLRKWCKENFLSYLRLREWADVHRQLHELVADMGLLRDVAEPSDPQQRCDAIHRALLTGLLANVGNKTDSREYLGARSTKFAIHPGSTLFKRRPAWVMSAELVETTRLYARTNAPVQPLWIERAAEHLLKRSYSDPHWQKASSHVSAYEKVSLFGLTIVPRRLVHYGPIDPATSRELFIHHALVEMDWKCNAPFFRHNRELIESVKSLEQKLRRLDLLGDSQQRYLFFDRIIPAGIYNGPLFEKWRRQSERANGRLLFMSIRDVVQKDVPEITQHDYPDSIAVNDMTLPLTYRFEPATQSDGITLTVPLSALNQLRTSTFDWLVPGYRQDKILSLIRSLPKALRTLFIPAPEVSMEAMRAIKPGDGSLLDALAAFLGKRSGQRVVAADFDLKSVPDHLKFNFAVIDSTGNVLRQGRDLIDLQKQLGAEVSSDFASLPKSEFNRDGLVRWDFGDLPDKVETHRHGMTLHGYPALVDAGKSASLRLFDSRDSARQSHREGVRRLFMVQLRKELQYLARSIPNIDRMSVRYAPLGTGDQLKEHILRAATDRAMDDHGGEVRTRDEFVRLETQGWKNLSRAAGEIARIVDQTLELYHEVSPALSKAPPTMCRPAYHDMLQQLESLVPPDFVTATPVAWLPHIPRFLRAIQVRLQKLSDSGLKRDTDGMSQIRPLVEQYLSRRDEDVKRGLHDPELEQFRWMLEELRVSVFAQTLKTSIPISPKRMESQWAKVAR